MKNLLATLAACALLAACASTEPLTPQQISDNAACRRADAPTGSHLVRRADCAPQPTAKN